MDTLRTIVKSILVVIIMATFLDIIMPRGDMKRYINLIIGLFVIIAMANPVLAAVHRGFSLDLFDTPAVSSGDTAAILRKGQDMAISQEKQAVDSYREKLARQVLALTDLYPQANIRQVLVEIVEDRAAADFGQVKKIILETGDGGGIIDSHENGEPGVADVELGEIGLESGSAPADAARQAGQDGRLQDMIANFYGLQPEQIEIR